MTRKRADAVLTERHVFQSRARAQEAIAAGLVRADGVLLTKPSQLIEADARIEAAEPHPYVSRGGVKLAAALDAFGSDPRDKICLDLGASTGGFSQVLLGRGALRVYAVDVGHGQLHRDVASDPRLVDLERTDARQLNASSIPDAIELISADVSFISLKLVLPTALALAGPRCDLALLVKPQFEAGRAHVNKGIVRDEGVHAKVCEEMDAFVRSFGYAVHGIIPSPIAGGDGNKEFLLGASKLPPSITH